MEMKRLIDRIYGELNGIEEGDLTKAEKNIMRLIRESETVNLTERVFTAPPLYYMDSDIKIDVEVFDMRLRGGRTELLVAPIKSGGQGQWIESFRVKTKGENYE